MRGSSFHLHRLARALLTVACIAAFLVRLPGGATAAGAGRWRQQAPPSASAAHLDLFAVQCPTASVCYALGNAGSPQPTHPAIEKTTDGGFSWSVHQFEDTPYSVEAMQHRPLACPSVDVCYLLVSTGDPAHPHVAVRVTRDGGQTWTARDTGTSGALEYIACPSTAVCYASVSVPDQTGGTPDRVVLSTGDGGATWTAANLTTLLGIHERIVDMSCPAIADCYLAVGPLIGIGPSLPPPRLAVTHDGGRTWNLENVPAPPRYDQLVSLACLAPDVCFVLAGSDADRALLFATGDGGGTWRQVATDVPGGRIVCGSPADCYNSEFYHTNNGGVTWERAAASALPSWTVALDVSCPAPTTCYAVATGIVVKTTDGRTWQEPTPYTGNTLASVACPGVTVCYAVGDGGTVLTTTDGGATWVKGSSGTSAFLSSIVCASLRVCFAIGNISYYMPGGIEGVIVKTSDGGRTWQTVQIDTRALTVPGSTCPAFYACFFLEGVACPTLAVCLMFATINATNAILRTTDSGQSWSAFPLSGGSQPLLEGRLACTAALRCMATGSWCVDMQDDETCLAWRSLLFTTTDGGERWRQRVDRTGGGELPLSSVACHSPSRCYAGGSKLWVRSTYSHGRWTVTQGPISGSYTNIRSLTCPGSQTCWGLTVVSPGTPAFHSIPVMTTNGGQSWHAVGRNLPDGQLEALTCPRAIRCYAVGQDGLIVAYFH